MIIDFHTHFYTQAYLDALERGDARAQLVQAADGTQRIQLDGDYSLIDPAHVQVAPILAAMAQNQVTHQLLTFSIPGLQVETAAQGVRLAQLVNDEFAAVVQQHSTQLSALAALPLQDATAATAELVRAVKQLGLRGGQLFSNINGTTLDDQSFWPLYAQAEALDVPLFIHPISPPSVETMRNYRLVPMMGFMFDTALAAAHLVFSGVMQRFPKLKIVLGNLGGTIPYLAGRMDRAFLAYPESQGVLTQAPSVYLKRMYYESAGMPDAGALRLALDFAGVDRVMFGSDFPQQIGDVPSAIALIDSLPLTPVDKAKVLGGNAAELLHLPMG